MSTYTVLGFVGYGVAALVAAFLSTTWQLPLLDRLAALFLPPLAFLLVVRLATRIVGAERIVFYQTASAGVIAAASASVFTQGNTARFVDVVVTGIGVFLVFGRIGCHSVACCHGRPGTFGVRYDARHVRVGFWARWADRTLWPVQLIESVASLGLVVVAVVVGWSEPGVPATVYVLGYAAVRFPLELLRGDAARPHWRAVSEAQWTAVATAAAITIWRPSIAAGALLGVLAAATLVLVLRSRTRELVHPSHLRELDAAANELAAGRGPARHVTSRGVALSLHELPDGRQDWIMSSDVAAWAPAVARRLALELWQDPEIMPGRLPGLFHAIARPRDRREAEVL